MIDWVTVLLALAITGALIGIFGFVAWKINVPDPLSAEILAKKDDHGSADSAHPRRKKDKSAGDAKKKRQETKKQKRKNSDEDERHSVTFKEATPVPSDESENDQDESEQSSSTPPPVATVAEVTLALSKKKKKKARRNQSPSHGSGILVNKDEKSPITDHPQPMPHPKLAQMIPKDEVELAKLHHQTKSHQGSAKQAPAAKKTAAASNDSPQLQQKEQPFTTVVNNRHKSGTPPVQQPQQQQQQPQQQRAKPATPAAAATPSLPAPPAPAAAAAASAPPLTSSVQPPTGNQVQHEPLAQRQPVKLQKEAPPTQVNGFNTKTTMNKPPAPPAATAPPMKISDMFKALPTSQAVVSELMLALDAYPLSADELNIVMHKIANKQAVINKDWSKLQHGQKVDPQQHIGQVLEETAKASEEDMRNNAVKRIKELTEELNNEKRRIQELLRDRDEKEKNIQMLRNQVDSIQHHQNSNQMNNQFQSLQLQIRSLTEENIQLNQRLSQQQQQQQQQHFQQQPMNNNETLNAGYRVIQEQLQKVSVLNDNLEKKLAMKDATVEKIQKEKDELARSNQKLTQRVQQLQQNEEKLVKELNDVRTSHSAQVNDLNLHLEQLQRDNEQLRHVELQAAASKNNEEEREQFQREIQQLKQTIEENQQRFDQQLGEYQQNKQRLSQEIEEYRHRLDEFQMRSQDQENHYRQEIERSKQEKDSEVNQAKESLTAEINALRNELNEVKATNDSLNAQRLEEIQTKQKEYLISLLPDDARTQLTNDQQNFDQWLSSYRQIFESIRQSEKENNDNNNDEAQALKEENERLRQNMRDIEVQLKEIENTVQTKEESLLADLRQRDATLTNIQEENERLREEIQRLRTEHDSAANEILSLKELIEQQVQTNNHSPSTVPDESLHTVRQLSSSPARLDRRAEELTELIRSSREAIENQDSIVQQLDKHINDMQRGGRIGEMNASNVEGSTASNEEPQQSES